MVFLLPHNPALRTLPSGARDMTDHHNFRKLEQSVRGCTDWYFWHMCATQQQEDRLQVRTCPAVAKVICLHCSEIDAIGPGAFCLALLVET